MKIKAQDRKMLEECARAGRDALAARGLTLASYQACDERIPRIHLAKDRAMRYRWDCLYAAAGGREIMDIIYEYANDEHVDTVLRGVLGSSST